MTTVYVTHPRCTEHDLSGHPEHAGRMRAVWQRLDETGLAARLKQQQATLISDDMILAVHTPAYLNLLARTSGQTMHLDLDTYVGPTSYEIARLSAGGVVDAVCAVMSGEAHNGFAITRPPGHHALPDRAMGFCLLSNVAIAVRQAQKAFGVQRILIVDYDVHHGNGTEAAFYEDDAVFFISTHQAGIYPGTGGIGSIGSGAGRGSTLNIPLIAGNSDANFAAIFEQIVWPAAQRFQPELILVSAGHDAHWADPLAGMRLSLKGYAHLARECVLMAKELCGGRIVFVMEGGYDLDVLGWGWCNIAHALLGDPDTHDPVGAPPGSAAEPNIALLIDHLQKMHNL